MIKRLKNNQKLLEFVRFVMVGVGAKGLNYFIYLIIEYVFHLDYNLAYTIGYIISFFFNFLASTFFTFKAEASTKNGIKFAGAHLINYFLLILLLNLFIFINIPSEIAPIFVFPVAIVINFFMVRFALKK